MPTSHLRTDVHYTLSIVTPTRKLYAAHVIYRDNGELEVTEFLNDHDTIDEVQEVIDQVYAWRDYDRVFPMPPGKHKMYVWDIERTTWENVLDDTDPADRPLLFPF